jgi:hypothetical protein
VWPMSFAWAGLVRAPRPPADGILQVLKSKWS